MTKLLTAAGMALLAGAATFAVAQPPAPFMPTTRAEAIAAVRALFARADADKDGFVKRAELPTSFRGPIVRRGGPDMLFDAMDRDKNGQISRAEFDAFHGGPNRMTVIDDGTDQRVTIIRRQGPGEIGHGAPDPAAIGLAASFDRADSNGDGKLSPAEAEAAALARFDRIDDNHDGTISPEERQAHAPRRMAMRWRDRIPPPAQ